MARSSTSTLGCRSHLLLCSCAVDHFPWFGLDTDWIERCARLEIDGIVQGTSEEEVVR